MKNPRKQCGPVYDSAGTKVEEACACGCDAYDPCNRPDCPHENSPLQSSLNKGDLALLDLPTGSELVRIRSIEPYSIEVETNPFSDSPGAYCAYPFTIRKPTPIEILSRIL